MKSLLALMRKEYMEATRTGKIMIIILLFVLFGIMSPAVAKLTPWMMKMLSDSMAESGLIVTNVQVDALTSWTQFFKNIPIALIAFVLIFSDIFTKEYKSGTLLLVLTKGLSRYKVVLAKTVLLLSIWTVGYRTLKPGGIFLFNIEHPVFTAGVGQDWIYTDDGKPQYWAIDNYFITGERNTHFLGCDVVKQHHTLTQIIMGLLNNGFELKVVEEAEPPKEMMDIPGMEDELRRPMMLLVKAIAKK